MDLDDKDVCKHVLFADFVRSIVELAHFSSKYLISFDFRIDSLMYGNG